MTREEASLQKIRRALDALRIDLGLREHLSSYQLIADGSTIYLADKDHAVDLVRQKGNLVIHEFVEVLQPFYVQGRQIPFLYLVSTSKLIQESAVDSRSSWAPGSPTTRWPP